MTIKNDHFLIAGQIWEEYFEGRRTLAWGKLGINKRDRLLQILRDRLHRKTNPKPKAPIKVKPELSKEDKQEMITLAQNYNKPITHVRTFRSEQTAVERMIAVMDLIEEKKP